MGIVDDNANEAVRKAVEVTSPDVYRFRTSGIATPAGLRTAGLVTAVALNSTTWTALPPSALTGRNALSIQNPSAIEIKINYSAVIVGYVGMVIGSGGERFYDITDDILVYGKSASGTPTINIEELS